MSENYHQINIANRLYPMKVNKESEEHIRLAAKY